MSEDRIYLQDLKLAGFCVKGSKEALENQGFSFRDLARHGISIEDLRAREFGGLVDHVLKIRDAARG